MDFYECDFYVWCMDVNFITGLACVNKISVMNRRSSGEWGEKKGTQLAFSAVRRLNV